MATPESNDTPDTVTGLGRQLRGDLVGPNDTGYEEGRTVWNAAVDRHPAAIVRPTGTADVITTVRFCRANELPLSIKSSGHMTTGNAVCDDGIVLDMSTMDAVRVDPDEQTVRVQSGATWAQVNHETMPFGLLAPGSSREIGVAGFTLGGGQGYLTRTHGMASDFLREADLVTAAGELVTVSEDNHEELFWALRGGGGNFGVVTSFEFDCFELSTEFQTADLLYPEGKLRDVLRLFRDQLDTAPDELLAWVSIMAIPETEGIPPARHGELGIFVRLTFVGDPTDADAAFEPFLTYGDPLMQATAIKPFPEVELDDEMPPGVRRHWESIFLNNLSEELIDMLGSRFPAEPSGDPFLTVFWFGGATSRFDSDATAFPHRNASYLLMIGSGWADPAEDEANREWVRGTLKECTQFGTGGEFLSLQTDSDEERVHAAFGDHYDRLKRIKTNWDPNNVFRVNQNIPPEA